MQTWNISIYVTETTPYIYFMIVDDLSIVFIENLLICYDTPSNRSTIVNK